MLIYGKTAANAIAVMSFLAGVTGGRRAGSAEIAQARSLSRALTAKLLTQLAAGGLVRGQPGPGGGYLLARDPRKISLFEIVSLFEQFPPSPLCPFGQVWCGEENTCPMHDSVLDLMESNRQFLEDTHLGIFLPQMGRTLERPKARGARRGGGGSRKERH